MASTTSGAGGAGAGADAPPHAAAVVGFVGVGTMSSAIVRGLCTAPADAPKSIVLSPRGKANATALASEFPSVCTIAESNQAVVDAADWVFLGVLPSMAEEVFAPLTFREGQIIINLLATSDNKHIAGLVAPATTIVRAVPLPPVALHACATLMCPPHAGVEALFKQLGGAVAVESDSQRELMQGVNCMMGPFYQFLVTITEWLGARGVPLSASGPYVSQLMQAIGRDAVEAGPKGFQHLVDEQTPGGLNEGAIRQLGEAGVWPAYKSALDTIYSRATGKDPAAAVVDKGASPDA